MTNTGKFSKLPDAALSVSVKTTDLTAFPPQAASKQAAMHLKMLRFSSHGCFELVNGRTGFQ